MSFSTARQGPEPTAAPLKVMTSELYHGWRSPPNAPAQPPRAGHRRPASEHPDPRNPELAVGCSGLFGPRRAALASPRLTAATSSALVAGGDNDVRVNADP